MSSLGLVLSNFAKHHAVDSGSLVVRNLSYDVLYLGGWKGRMDLLRGEIGRVCGLAVGDGSLVYNDDYILLSLGFEKYRLLSRPSNLPGGLLDLDIGFGVSVVQSHSFCHLGLSGVGVGDLFRLLFLVDLGGDVFVDGSFVVVGYHHVGVGVHYLGGEYVLHFPSGIADSLCESILEVAADLGVEVKL